MIDTATPWLVLDAGHFHDQVPHDSDLYRTVEEWCDALVEWCEASNYWCFDEGGAAVLGVRWDGERYEAKFWRLDPTGSRPAWGGCVDGVTEWSVPPIPPPVELLPYAVREGS